MNEAFASGRQVLIEPGARWAKVSAVERVLEDRLVALGFDLLYSFSASTIADDLVAFGVSDISDGTRALLVGNRTELWERLRHRLAEEPARLLSMHPLDEFVEEAIGGVVSQSAASTTVLYGHRKYGSAYVPLQRWAQRTGFLALSPSHLSVHREYGPWLALRALILYRDAPPRSVSACAAPALEPCASCSAPCVAPFQRAMRLSASSACDQRVTDHWQDFLAVRDACPIGKQYRYSDAQIRYHYARDRTALQLK